MRERNILRYHAIRLSAIQVAEEAQADSCQWESMDHVYRGLPRGSARYYLGGPRCVLNFEGELGWKHKRDGRCGSKHDQEYQDTVAHAPNKQQEGKSACKGTYPRAVTKDEKQ